MRRPRVLVLSDQIGELTSAISGAALARGFADRAEVAVVPVGVGGWALAQAVAAISGDQVLGDGRRWAVRGAELALIGLQQTPDLGWSPQASSAELGRWVAEALSECAADTVAVDLTGITAHDGGAGFLAEAAAALTGRTLIGIVATEELDLPATGVTGGLARRAHGAGVQIAEVLAADTELKIAAEALGAGLSLAPGGGAAGGCGLAILSLNGRLFSGPQFCHSLAGVERSLLAADLVVTGCSELSALDRGGVVVGAVAAWAERAQRPCVAFAGGEELSRREVRTFGLEAAHHLPAPINAAQLEMAAARVATSWFLLRDHDNVD